MFMLQKKYDMKNDRIIDIHCHSSAKPFLSGVPPVKTIFEEFSFKRNKKISKIIEMLSSIRNSTQSNFDNLYNGGVRIAFLSLTPIEKGFLKKSALDIIRYPTLGNITENEVISALTGFDIQLLSNIQSNQFTNYFTQSLIPEYQWLIWFDNHNSPSFDYTVKFPKNFNDLEANLLDDGILNIILNIEGAHAFAIAPSENMLEQKYTYQQTELVTIFSNINELKINQPIPIFSVGLMHHFWNGLGGHSASFLNQIKYFKKQSIGLNDPLNDAGKQVINELLRDRDGKKGYVLDIKHMSPQARANYYQMRKENQAFYEDKPILCSHTGIAMYFESLKEWIDNDEDKITGDCYLHEKSINLCREDIVEIFESNGLIGIQLDEKRLFGKSAFEDISNEKLEDQVKSTTKMYSYKVAKYFWANIFSAIDDLSLHYKSISPKYWDIFSIGSDFDGLINHLENCPDASCLSSFRESLYSFLIHPEKIVLYENKESIVQLTIDRIVELKAGLDNKTLIEKLFFNNAYEFLRRNF